MTKLGKYQVGGVGGGGLVLFSTRDTRQSFDATSLLVSISFQLLTSQSEDSQHITNPCAFWTSVCFVTAWWHTSGYFETLWSLWSPFLPPSLPLSLSLSLFSLLSLLCQHVSKCRNPANLYKKKAPKKRRGTKKGWGTCTKGQASKQPKRREPQGGKWTA